jgi:hypothetical protein
VDWFHVRESRLKGFDVLASLCVIVVLVPKRAYFTQHQCGFRVSDQNTR